MYGPGGSAGGGLDGPVGGGPDGLVEGGRDSLGAGGGGDGGRGSGLPGHPRNSPRPTRRPQWCRTRSISEEIIIVETGSVTDHRVRVETGVQCLPLWLGAGPGH